MNLRKTERLSYDDLIALRNLAGDLFDSTSLKDKAKNFNDLAESVVCDLIPEIMRLRDLMTTFAEQREEGRTLIQALASVGYTKGATAG